MFVMFQNRNVKRCFTFYNLWLFVCLSCLCLCLPGRRLDNCHTCRSGALLCRAVLVRCDRAPERIIAKFVKKEQNIFKQNDDSENAKSSRKSFREMKKDEMTWGEYFSSTLFQHSQRIGHFSGIETSSYFLIQFKLRTAHTFEERLLCEKY